MPVKERNEKSFVWHDMKINTLYGRIYAHDPSSSPHAHSQFEMFVLKTANGYIMTDKEKIKLSRNHLILIPPDTNHAVHFDNPSAVVGMTIRFHYKKINDRRQQNNGQIFTYFDSLMPMQNNIMILKDKHFGNFCTDFFEENESVPLLASALIIHMMQGLFLQILRCISNPKLSKQISLYSYKTAALSNDVIIGNIIEVFMSQPDCTLNSLADQLKMSPRNVQRILKKTYNKSFTEMLAEIRLNKAKNLIKSSNFTLREIAEKCNYNKYDSFRKAFLNIYGVSPSSYREKQNKTK